MAHETDTPEIQVSTIVLILFKPQKFMPQR